MSTKVDCRADAIMRVIVRDEETSVRQLVQEIGTSATNVRRDLTRLEKRGLVLRTHGGVSLTAKLFSKPFERDRPLHVQQLERAHQKRRIGLVASELIEEGETVGLAAGTTTTQVGRALRHRRNISVITNALNIAMELSHQHEIKTTLTGGALAEGKKFSLVTESAISFLKGVYLNKLFLGVTAFDLVHGATTNNLDEATVCQAMIHQAAQVIVVADSSKLNRADAVGVCACSAVDVLVTDEDIAKEAREAFQAKGIRVVCA
jgi:DeoR family transcriptional regulator of aga operon